MNNEALWSGHCFSDIPVQFFYTREQKDKRSEIFLSKFVWGTALPALGGWLGEIGIDHGYIQG